MKKNGKYQASFLRAKLPPHHEFLLILTTKCGFLETVLSTIRNVVKTNFQHFGKKSNMPI